jgi:N-acyl-D-aspartate/D-glutamate deacylase
VFDLLIRNARIIDGTGAPARHGDIGVAGGRIAAVGDASGSARRTFDADGLVVAPGFIDLHTHLDGQLFWDPLASPSSHHGFTTVLAGNCGFTFAPVAPGGGDDLLRLMAVVEGIPLETLRASVPFNWTSFGQYLDALDGRIAVNAGFLVGHSALRQAVMAERAIGGAATEADVDAMAALLDASLREGGLGFSSSWNNAQVDEHGDPAPSRAASVDELVRLSSVVGRWEGTTLEFSPGVVFGQRETDVMIAMSRAAARAVNWNVIQVRTADRSLIDRQLSASDAAAEHGAEVYALTFPDATSSWHSLQSGLMYDVLPGWADTMHAPLPERMRLLRDPAVRARLADGAQLAEGAFFKLLAAWDDQRVFATYSPANDGLVGRTLGSIAAERGVTPLDAWLDISLADELRAMVALPCVDDRDELWEMRLEVWRDRRTLLGGSDAGAHLDMLASQRYSTALLSKGVRRRGLLPIEEAVHMLTAAPAALYGLADRGRIAPGCAADLVVFDPDAVGHGEMHARHDLPLGALRIYVESVGIDRVIVNGTEILVGGVPTGERPGHVLRRGSLRAE